MFGASDSQSTNYFLTGAANHAFISISTPLGRNVVAAVTHAYGGTTAVEIGVGQFGPVKYGVVHWGHTTQVTGQAM
jgi:filamentous hemagglutinin